MNEPAPHVPDVFPSRTLGLVGLGYMLLMWALAQGLHQPDLTRLFIATVFPLVWLTTFLIHWILGRTLADFVAACRARFAKQPGWTMFYTGWFFLVSAWAIDIALNPLTPATRDLGVFEVVGMLIASVAAVGGLLIRRTKP